ncbi:MAG: hypothetical protein LBB38_01670 [Puniceicoccales bacterium]|nr:hypothetical protein [Puniceicoccales bacterium]
MPFRVVDVAPVRDFSGEPGLAAAIWPQICAEIERSPLLHCGAHGAADAVLVVDIKSLEQTIAVTSQSDPSMAAAYRLTVKGLCSLQNVRCGGYFLRDIPVTASISVPADSSYQDRKYIALPKLTRDFAAQIINAIAHPW